jgi:hypothetical protein
MNPSAILSFLSRTGGKFAPSYLCQYLQASPALIAAMVADGSLKMNQSGLIHLP